MKCQLCDRDIINGSETEHHLVPISRDGAGGASVFLHEICHKQIHALFGEKELATRFNTIEKLKEHKDVQRFLGWIKSKAPEFNAKIRVSHKNR